MGHRRKRKRERQAPGAGREQWSTSEPSLNSDWLGLSRDRESMVEIARDMAGGMRTAVANTCGRCREFIEDQEGGRGSCLHPGSGIVAPWTDTEACPFFVMQRQMRRGR